MKRPNLRKEMKIALLFTPSFLVKLFPGPLWCVEALKHAASPKCIFFAQIRHAPSMAFNFVVFQFCKKRRKKHNCYTKVILFTFRISSIPRTHLFRQNCVRRRCCRRSPSWVLVLRLLRTPPAERCTIYDLFYFATRMLQSKPPWPKSKNPRIDWEFFLIFVSSASSCAANSSLRRRRSGRYLRRLPTTVYPSAGCIVLLGIFQFSLSKNPRTQHAVRRDGARTRYGAIKRT